MAIEVTNGATTITGEHLEAYRLVTLHAALRLQAKTGMKACRISATACAQWLGFKGRTAKTLLADMERQHPELKK